VISSGGCDCTDAMHCLDLVQQIAHLATLANMMLLGVYTLVLENPKSKPCFDLGSPRRTTVSTEMELDKVHHRYIRTGQCGLHRPARKAHAVTRRSVPKVLCTAPGLDIQSFPTPAGPRPK
jgi:hypothetical protein